MSRGSFFYLGERK